MGAKAAYLKLKVLSGDAFDKSFAASMVSDHESDIKNEENDRKWCTLLVEMDEAYGASPPSTETGRRIAQAIHQRRVDLGC